MDNFLEIHKEGMDKSTGFWAEESISILLKTIENRYKTDIIRNWAVRDVSLNTSNSDKLLVKWVKRDRPLTDLELTEKYGRSNNFTEDEN